MLDNAALKDAAPEANCLRQRANLARKVLWQPESTGSRNTNCSRRHAAFNQRQGSRRAGPRTSACPTGASATWLQPNTQGQLGRMQRGIAAGKRDRTLITTGRTGSVFWPHLISSNRRQCSSSRKDPRKATIISSTVRMLASAASIVSGILIPSRSPFCMGRP